MFNDSDIAVRETDFDALSSRLSCYLKNYNPEDELLLDIVPLLLHYTILEIQSDFKRFAVSRKLKSQFFNLFPTNLIDLQKILDLNTSLVRSRINRFTPLKSPMINRVLIYGQNQYLIIYNVLYPHIQIMRKFKLFH